MSRFFSSFDEILFAAFAIQQYRLFITTEPTYHDFSPIIIMPFGIAFMAFIARESPATTLESKPTEAIFIMFTCSFFRKL
jgi:hypothetical protein